MSSIHYSVVDSPFGALLAASSSEGLLRVAFPEEDPEFVLEELEDLDPGLAKGSLDEERREFDEYFDGKRTAFDLPVDMRLSADGFSREVLRATSGIPYGSVSTYRDVAARAGNSRAARAAGNALRQNPVPIVVPCHRVVRSGGGLGGYAGREDRKAFLLDLEGAVRP